MTTFWRRTSSLYQFMGRNREEKWWDRERPQRVAGIGRPSVNGYLGTCPLPRLIYLLLVVCRTRADLFVLRTIYHNEDDCPAIYRKSKDTKRHKRFLWLVIIILIYSPFTQTPSMLLQKFFYYTCIPFYPTTICCLKIYDTEGHEGGRNQSPGFSRSQDRRTPVVPR